MKNLISMRDLDKADIIKLLSTAEKIESGELKINIEGKLAALLFFEPSTRTLFSFDTAMKKMGGKSLIMTGTGTTSVSKGESFSDTLMTISQYADIIIQRSPIEGAARYASEVVDIPVVNAGDGANQHPTQALLDLYSIMKTQGTLESLKIGMVGDLKFGRTVHSLCQALADFQPEIHLISPTHLRMPQHILDDMDEKEINWKEGERLENIIKELDILYVTRIQKERFADLDDYKKVKGSYILSRSMLNDVKKNLKILHPLPRVDEIDTDVDATEYAYYFPQARNGVFTRQAIIATLLGEV
ncbi:MAG: aspartate carbamoyltransferase [Candidatus Cloacimonetes bacterium]|nr:aspartate carbamoyltransferase [Candidatus Cloacimonadota bacterium]